MSGDAWQSRALWAHATGSIVSVVRTDRVSELGECGGGLPSASELESELGEDSPTLGSSGRGMVYPPNALASPRGGADEGAAAGVAEAWTEHLTVDGFTLYHSSVTGESDWEPPTGGRGLAQTMPAPVLASTDWWGSETESEEEAERDNAEIGAGDFALVRSRSAAEANDKADRGKGGRSRRRSNDSLSSGSSGGGTALKAARAAKAFLAAGPAHASKAARLKSGVSPSGTPPPLSALPKQAATQPASPPRSSLIPAATAPHLPPTAPSSPTVATTEPTPSTPIVGKEKPQGSNGEKCTPPSAADERARALRTRARAALELVESERRYVNSLRLLVRALLLLLH
ncbi:hypothetical protein T492DRAFT_842548 [Pavlovales sp. CCMP2436]|nr:hypothetical protein T492DRAFT_842548 [Pavlovales sp. CCMP2436]